MNKKILVVGLVLVLALGCSIGLQAAQNGSSTDSNNIIYAAYHRVTGDLRIVSDGKLKPNEVALSWNIQGPQGPQGEQGPMGPEGPAGDQMDKPLAYAFVREDGMKLSGTQNLNVQKVDQGLYRLSIAGEDYQPGKYLVFVTPSNVPCFPTTLFENGKAYYDILFSAVNGEAIDAAFQVMIYKTNTYSEPVNYYRDYDRDGYGLTTDCKLLSSPEDYYTAMQGGDFNDNDPQSYPGAPERPDARDNDGDGKIDEDFEGTVYYRDNDEDGYGYTERGHFGMEFSDFIYADKPVYPYTALRSGDWDDGDRLINPGVEDVPDGIDNNCDGIID